MIHVYFAACKGYLEILQWAKSQRCPWDSNTCSFAAKFGHLEILQWVRSQSCPWDSRSCSYAALNGHLEVLQWARSQGCPWDTLTCSYAAMKGHLIVLQWARCQGCPWNSDTYLFWSRSEWSCGSPAVGQEPGLSRETISNHAARFLGSRSKRIRNRDFSFLLCRRVLFVSLTDY